MKSINETSAAALLGAALVGLTALAPAYSQGFLDRGKALLKGMGGPTDDLDLRLNRAAEAAVPKAKTLFGDAIAKMTIDDTTAIVNGPKDYATEYFRANMSAPLAADMKPIVKEQLANVGAFSSISAARKRPSAKTPPNARPSCCGKSSVADPSASLVSGAGFPVRRWMGKTPVAHIGDVREGPIPPGFRDRRFAL